METGLWRKARADAPNLRLVGAQAPMRCANCTHFADGFCDLFDFSPSSNELCDAWEPRAAVTTSANRKASPARFAVEIVEKNVDQRLAFGWLYVSRRKDGSQVVDHSGEIVRPETLERASYKFALDSRLAKVFHDGPSVGRIVELVVFTPEKRKAMGVPDGVLPDGIWVGFKIEDDRAWKRVKSGELRMLSFGARVIRRMLSETERTALQEAA